MRNLSVIKGMYQGNGLTRTFNIPFEYNDTSQICVTVTTYFEGDYTYELIDSAKYSIDTGAQTITYPTSLLEEPISSSQILTVWRDTDLLQLMDLTNQGAAWPDSIEAALDKLTQIVQELNEGLSRAVKVDIGDPQTPQQKLLDMQDYVLSAAMSAGDASASASRAGQAAEAAAVSEAHAAESEALAGGYADTATDAASRAEKSAESARAYNAPAYDSAVTYQPGDVVTYDDGNSYRAIAETTGHEPPNIIYWQKVTDYVGDDFFEIDEYGYIVPMDSPSHSRYWRVDQNGYIVPIEGGDGGYRPDTRYLSSEYLNVTNEGYVKHLSADDIAAQEVDADEVTAQSAAFTTAAVGTLTAQNATITNLTAGTITADDVIAKGPVVDVRAYGAKGDGITDDTAAIQSLINAVDNVTIYFPHGEYLISDTIRTNQDGSQHVSFRLDDNAEIITNTALDPMIELNGDTSPRWSFVGGRINGNGVAASGIFLRRYIRPYIYNVTIFDCLDKHMIIGDNFAHLNAAANISNIQVFTTVHETQSYGIYHRGGDSYIDCCRLFGVKTGVYSDTSVYVSRVHTCLANDSYSGSVAFDINVGGGITSLTDCYADGYETSYKLAGQVSMNHCMTYLWEKKEDYELGVYAKPTIIDIGSYNNPSTILDINGLRVHSYDGIPVRLLDRLPATPHFALNNRFKVTNLAINNVGINNDDLMFFYHNDSKNSTMLNDSVLLNNNKYYKVADVIWGSASRCIFAKLDFILGSANVHRTFNLNLQNWGATQQITVTEDESFKVGNFAGTFYIIKNADIQGNGVTYPHWQIYFKPTNVNPNYDTYEVRIRQSNNTYARAYTPYIYEGNTPVDTIDNVIANWQIN